MNAVVQTIFTRCVAMMAVTTQGKFDKNSQGPKDETPYGLLERQRQY